MLARLLGKGTAIGHDRPMTNDADPSRGSLHAKAHPHRQRKARWIALAAVLVWFAIAAIGGPLVGRLTEVQTNDNASFLPKSAESTQVNNFIAQTTDTQSLSYLVVIERPAGLQAADQSAIQSFLAGIPALALPGAPQQNVGQYLSGPVSAAVPSADKQAVLVPVSIQADKASDVVAGQSVLYEVAQALRTSAQQKLGATGLNVYVTGQGGFLADLVTAFGAIGSILLLVALGVVFVILLIVYRSPILPFAVLMTSVFGLAVAALFVYPLAKNGTISLSGQSQGILSILVVGAATDYGLLLVARYREELHDHETAWQAMKVAWRASLEPIAASAATVMICLLCLRLSQLGSTQGLGPVGALGIVGAFVAALTFLPAVLVLIGRRIFWPKVPPVDHVRHDHTGGQTGLWGRVAGLIGGHPRRTWAITFLALAACAAFLPTFNARGVTQSDLFLKTVDSVTGQQVLGKHFPAGAGAPVQIVVPQAKAQQVVTTLGTLKGLSDPFIGQTPGQPPKVVNGSVLVQATLTASSDSIEAEDVIKQLRTTLAPSGPGILVGGSSAVNVDILDASDRDLRVIIPTILAVIFVILSLLLRSLVAPLILVAANVLSFAATLGVSALMFNHVFHFPGSDPSTPLYGFVFLVALGIDYSIFLMTRVREESVHRGTRPGILVGLAVTGAVITSAGIVLAATFSALAVLPILFLVQIAFIVAFGVLLDTIVVRSLLVPAVAHDVGRRVWWPSKLSRSDADDT